MYRFGGITQTASVNVIVANQGTGMIRTMLDPVTRRGVRSQGGDSGGPYWGNYDGSYFAGIHKGATINTEDYETVMYMYPYYEIQRRTGGRFRLKTN